MKKLNQKGFTNHLLLLGIIAVVVGVVSFGGYRVYKSRQIDAKALAPTPILGSSLSGINACRFSARGIRFQFVNNTDKTYTFKIVSTPYTVKPWSSIYKSIDISSSTFYAAVYNWPTALNEKLLYSKTVNVYSLANC